jgi:hypothetical protein
VERRELPAKGQQQRPQEQRISSRHFFMSLLSLGDPFSSYGSAMYYCIPRAPRPAKGLLCRDLTPYCGIPSRKYREESCLCGDMVLYCGILLIKWRDKKAYCRNKAPSCAILYSSEALSLRRWRIPSPSLDAKLKE